MTWKRSDLSRRSVAKTGASRRSAWTKAQIRRARQVALRPVLKDLGYQFTELRNGNYLVHHLAASIIVKDHFWICKDPGQAGNAIDFLVEIQNMSFSHAVDLLLSYTSQRTTTTEI